MICVPEKCCFVQNRTPGSRRLVSSKGEWLLLYETVILCLLVHCLIVLGNDLYWQKFISTTSWHKSKDDQSNLKSLIDFQIVQVSAGDKGDDVSPLSVTARYPGHRLTAANDGRLDFVLVAAPPLPSRSFPLIPRSRRPGSESDRVSRYGYVRPG